MHVLIIPSWYKSDKEPHSGTFFEEQARMLQRKGLKVGVLYPHHNHSFLEFLKSPKFSVDHAYDNGLFTTYSTTKSVMPTIIGHVLNKKVVEKFAYKSFVQYCEINGRPDIIHAHSVFWGGVVAEYILKKAGIPFVLTEHLSSLLYLPDYERPPLCNYIKSVYGCASQNIFVSDQFKDAIVNKYKVQKTTIIGNVVNPVFFENNKREIISSRFNIINIGALIPMKNQMILIEALKLISRPINCHINLTIVGEGILYDQLLNEADTVQNGVTIKFIPRANRIEIAKLMGQNHILVSSSIFETFGLTLAEAHASGIPVIAYKTFGTDDIMTNENGIVIEENTPVAFAEAILYMYKNYHIFNHIAISNECHKRFSEETIFAQLLEVYKKILFEK